MVLNVDWREVGRILHALVSSIGDMMLVMPVNERRYDIACLKNTMKLEEKKIPSQLKHAIVIRLDYRDSICKMTSR